MTLSINDVKKIAELARIELEPGEDARLAETISSVLEYMKILNEVDTDGVEPTFQVTGLSNVLREDVVVGNDMREKLIAAFPQKVWEELVVPGVFASE